MITFGQYIRETRDKRDISLRELAKKIDCSPAFLSDIELGKRNPSDDVLEKIAKYLSVPIIELKKYDTRVTLEDIKRSSKADPNLAFAFRTILDKNISSEELLKFAAKHSNRIKKQKR